MPQGVIRIISLSDGFGFIQGSSEDVFFHRSAVSGVFFDELEEGQSVKYRLATVNSDRRKNKRHQGPEAVAVKPID